MRQRITLRQVCLVTPFSGLLLSGGSTYTKERKLTIIATEGGYESWDPTLPGGKLNDFEPELMANLCQRMQIECKLVVQNWGGMVAGLNTGKYDVIVGAIVVTPERPKVVAFTQAHVATPTFFVAVKGSLLPPSSMVKPYDDEKEIQVVIVFLHAASKGKAIGIASDTVYTSPIDKYSRDTADIRECNNSADTIFDPQAERIDAAFDDIASANITLLRLENNNLALSGPLMSGSIWGGSEAMGVCLTDTDFKAKLDSATQTALVDGMVKKLSEKWLKSGVTP